MSGIRLFMMGTLGVVVLLWLQQRYSFSFPSSMHREPNLMKMNISLFDPTQWNADASVENGDIDTNTLVDALQLVEAQVPNNKDMTLAELRGGGSLGALTISAFAYLDVEHNCITPLSPFQETFTLPFDDTEDKMVLVGLTSEDALLHEYLNPPQQVMLWDMKRKKQSRIDFYAAFDAGSRLYCRPWYEKFLLLKKMCEQRTYFHGLFEKSTGGKDIFGDDSIERSLTTSFKYHGWRAVDDYKEASVLLGSFNKWKPSFANQDPFILKAIINRNIYGLFGDKFLQYEALKKVSVKKPCVDLKNIIPTTYSASDPEDCKKIEEILGSNSSSSKSWLRKVGYKHRGEGVELVHEMDPDDCKMDFHSDSVLYQEMIEALKINGRASSFRMNLLLASFDPLVAFTNFQNGHVYINKREDKAWRTQGYEAESWTFEMLDAYMLESHGISNFFATHVYPQWQHIVDVLLEILKPRLVGGKGHFEILCFDIMMNEEYKLYVLEINHGCNFGGETDFVPQRMHAITDTIPIIMEVQGRILSDRSVLELVNEERIYMHKGNYELVYSNQPGASYERSLCLDSSSSNSIALSTQDPSISLIGLLDPTQWNADASVENGDIDTNTLVDALQLVEVQVPNNKDMTLAELRGGGSLGALTISAFAYLDVEHNCITPLSPFQETFTLPFDDTEDKMVLVGLTSEDALLHEYLNPPQQVMLWDMKRKKQSRIDFYSAFDAGSRLYCRPWYEKFLLLKKLCEQRTYFHGLFEKSTGGKDIFGNDPIERRLVSSFKYYGWKAVEDYKEASVLLGSFNQWKPSFANQDPFILKAIINRNIYGLFGSKLGKFHQLKALKKASEESPCVNLKHIIPKTYSASDPEDCNKIKELFDPNNSSSKSWLRKVGAGGEGVELVHEMDPDDCKMDFHSDSVLYQEMIEALKINGRASSFRMNLLLASFDPLVAFTNFQNGHVAINKREDRSWYTQGGDAQEYWTFGVLDEYMLETRGISNFFATHIYPQWQHIVDVLLEILKPRLVGGKGHFEILCFDMMLSNNDYRLYLLEVNHGCLFPGESDFVPQRMHVIADTVPVIMEVQGRILSDKSVMDLVDEERIYMHKGNYELVYSNQPGASYERSLCFNSNATNPVALGTQQQSHPSGKTHFISHHHHDSSFSKMKKGSETMKMNISLFDPTQWNADASVENGDIDTNTLVDALQLVEVQVPNNKDMNLAELRGGGSLGALTISAFAYLDVEHNCITPLSPFQETFTLPFDDTEAKMVLVGLTSEDALLHEYLNPPQQVMLWDMKRKKQSRIDFYAAFDAGSRLYCRPWYEKFLLLKKLCEQKTYFHGQNEPFLVTSIKYHGWRAVEDYQEASVLLGSFTKWKPSFANQNPFLMKAIINRNIYGLFGDKFLQYEALKKVSVEKPCVDLKHIIPTTYSASDPEDCNKIKEILGSNSSSSKSWLRKVGDVHQGKGVELVHQMHPDDCKNASLSGRSVNLNSMVKDHEKSNVFYQEMIEALKINGRASSFRMNLLLASFDPLVAFTNFQNGLVYINNREDRSWYTQGGFVQEYWTFEMLDEYMLETQGISNFFATHIYPQWQHMADVLLEILKPLVVGGKGHFEILCFDMMLSNDDYRLYLIEVNHGCGYFWDEKYINQEHIIVDTLFLTMEVQGRILSDRSVMDLVDEERIYMHKGNYELVYSNQPGASYERSLCLDSNTTNPFAEEPSPPLKNIEHNEL